MTPERLGRFELLELLGAGGMGAVYRARDVASGEVVALKVLHGLASALGGEAYARFRREVAALGRARHPRIVALRGELEQDGPRSFYAMEYVEGRSLAELLRARGRLSAREAAAVGLLLLDALGAAHERGIVHRDVKPSNILVGRGGVLKVADFGLARSSETTGLTATGQAPGTPAYMSPEQAEGHPADARSDLYAAGAVLYALLAGRPPFEAESPLAVLRMHVTRPPPPLDERAPGTPPALAAAIERALAKDPAARFPGAGAMREAIRAAGLVSGDADAQAAIAALDPGAEATPAAPTRLPASLSSVHPQGPAQASPTSAHPERSPAQRAGRSRRAIVAALLALVAAGAVIATRAPTERPGDPVVARTRAGEAIAGRLLRFDARGAAIELDDGRVREVPAGELAEIRRGR